jgi:hypothetical protein
VAGAEAAARVALGAGCRRARARPPGRALSARAGKWKLELELGHNIDTAFGNPDFVAYAESFGARGYRIGELDESLS